MTKILLLMAITASQAAAGDAKAPEQAARGQAIFFDENAVARCGSCHSLAGKGTTVGPDISRLARLSPRGIATAIRATSTQYVQTVRLKAGSAFPGIPAAKDTGKLQYYDLSSKPPVLRKFEQGEVSSTSENATWKHPPSSAGFTAHQLADVIAYIKWRHTAIPEALIPTTSNNAGACSVTPRADRVGRRGAFREVEAARLREPARGTLGKLTSTFLYYVEQHVKAGTPLELPGSVASVYLQNPDARPDHECADCGYDLPVASSCPGAEPTKVYFESCPPMRRQGRAVRVLFQTRIFRDS
jgi:hypothetical protein